jgi:Multidrug resistance efflux pump
MSRSKSILPIQQASLTAEALFNRLSRSGSYIYSATLLLLLVGLPLLLSVKIDIVARAPGLLKSPMPNHRLNSLVTGIIDTVYIQEYQYIEKGDTLLRMEQAALTGALEVVTARKEELLVLLEDLRGLKDLSERDEAAPLILKTPYYSRAYAHYQAQQQTLAVKTDETRKLWERNTQLYQSKAISPSDYEATEATYFQAKAALQERHQASLQQWRAEELNYQKELRELEAQQLSLQKENTQYWLLAPVSGSVSYLSGLAAGSPLVQGQALLEISPEEPLWAECYIQPRQIGFLQTGQQVRIAADAFPHTQWGSIQGAVQQITPMMQGVESSQAPYFKLLCNLESHSLHSAGGLSAQLKKGMTVQARIVLCRRSIFQLLYARADSWLNPTLSGS